MVGVATGSGGVAALERRGKAPSNDWRTEVWIAEDPWLSRRLNSGTLGTAAMG